MDWYLNPVSTTVTNCENLAHSFPSWSHGLLIYKLKILISTSRELYCLRSRGNHVFAVRSTVPGSRVCTQVIQTIKSPVFLQGLKIAGCPPALPVHILPNLRPAWVPPSTRNLLSSTQATILSHSTDSGRLSRLHIPSNDMVLLC